MASEGFSKTVDFRDEILERTWMYSQRVSGGTSGCRGIPEK